MKDLLYLVALLFVGAVAPRSVKATSLTPFQPQRVVIDRIAEGTPKHTAEAVKLLKSIIEGRAGSVPVEQARLFGAEESELSSKWFKEPEVRAYAVRILALLGSDEAIEYLMKLTPRDLLGDPGYVVYAAAQIEFRRAVLRREPDRSRQISSLEPLLNHRSDPWVSPYISAWALEELCNRGSVASMPLIIEAIEGRNPSAPSEDIRFCDARMQIVNSGPDLIATLGSLLQRLDNPPPDFRTVGWAIAMLEDYHTPRAEAALDRFVEVALQLSGDSPETQALRTQGAVLRMRKH